MAFLPPSISPLSFDLSGVAFAALSKTWILQRQYNWQLMMPHLINGVYGPLISSFCQDVSFGNYSLKALGNMQQGAFQRFYAGLQDIDGASLTFITSIDNAVLDYFHGWYHLMIDQDGYYYPKDNYKKPITISLYDRSGIESVRFTLKGCFPKAKPKIPLSYSSTDVLHLDVNLSVDSVEMYSFIGSIRGAVTNVIGDVARKTAEMLGGTGGLNLGKSSPSGNII